MSTWLFVDCPHVQLEGADAEAPQHLGVHHLADRKRKTTMRRSSVWQNDKIYHYLTHLVWTHRQPDDFVEEDLFVGKEVKHKILKARKEGWLHYTTHAWSECSFPFICSVPFVIWFCSSSHLIVKGSVGSLFDCCLFLFVANLNHDTGVDVLTNQLLGLCDVNCNLHTQKCTKNIQPQ